MKTVIPLDQVGEGDRPLVGGKAMAACRLMRLGVNTPVSLCVTTQAYQWFVESNRLNEKLAVELGRKPFEEMRWEELWDISLRIRNIFLRTPWPDNLRTELLDELDHQFGSRPTAVRSSAPEEDAAGASFAGMHDSYLNISGGDRILEHIVLVWASLWSDRALLYRQELNLDIKRSVMAVLVQELKNGEKSGVIFGRNPLNRTQAVIEAVYGLNQGLIDGLVEPDRWFLDRKSGRVIEYQSAERRQAMRVKTEGVGLVDLEEELRDRPPLADVEISEVHALARKAELEFKNAQDVEWTYDRGLCLLQSRPITTGSDAEDDNRTFYLNLTVSLENLKRLRQTMEEEVIPNMERAYRELSSVDLNTFNNNELSREVRHREQILEQWTEVYWRDCIPFAHGVRLFGQIYNDVMQPEDPFEFIDLLKDSNMIGAARNRAIMDLAEKLVHNRKVSASAQWTPEMESGLNDFLEEYGDLAWESGRLGENFEALKSLIYEMADNWDNVSRDLSGNKKKASHFIDHFEGQRKTEMLELLDLARTSYRLRDDDNIHLGRIKARLIDAKHLLEQRLSGETDTAAGLTGVTTDINYPRGKIPERDGDPEKLPPNFKIRQLIGQPAGPGVGQGRARVITDYQSLLDFKSGDVLVCDAVEPNMTLVAPLASGIVERRGGMLIHGAIIAREYEIPCVTGVADAASLIKDGDRVTVDGYLGLVIIGETYRTITEDLARQ